MLPKNSNGDELITDIGIVSPIITVKRTEAHVNIDFSFLSWTYTFGSFLTFLPEAIALSLLYSRIRRIKGKKQISIHIAAVVASYNFQVKKWTNLIPNSPPPTTAVNTAIIGFGCLTSFIKIFFNNENKLFNVQYKTRPDGLWYKSTKNTAAKPYVCTLSFKGNPFVYIIPEITLNTVIRIGRMFKENPPIVSIASGAPKSLMNKNEAPCSKDKLDK